MTTVDLSLAAEIEAAIKWVNPGQITCRTPEAMDHSLKAATSQAATLEAGTAMEASLAGIPEAEGVLLHPATVGRHNP